MTTLSTVLFISGPLDLTQTEFDKYYKPVIDKHEGGFVVGDARGADNMAQLYLEQRMGVYGRVFYVQFNRRKRRSVSMHTKQRRRNHM